MGRKTLTSFGHAWRHEDHNWALLRAAEEGRAESHPHPSLLSRRAGDGNRCRGRRFVGASPRVCPPSWPRCTKLALVGGVLTLGVSGCGVFQSATSATPTPSPLPTLAQPPTPGIAAQIDRAKRLGPGFLDYCPHHEGAAQAQYDVMLPGQRPIGGFCQTHVSRQPGGDIITFYAHWDARSIHHGQGTVSFTYGVARVATPPATPVAEMLDQTGPLPP
jgi:hypothetical protein